MLRITDMIFALPTPHTPIASDLRRRFLFGVLCLAPSPRSQPLADTPHLDRWEHESKLTRELTILFYANPGWDTGKHGGALRLHSPDTAAQAISAERNRRRPPGAASTPSPPVSLQQQQQQQQQHVDVAPTAGRIVIFQSGTQLHEVLPCTNGAQRLALTLWVEHAEWRGGG